MLNPDVVIGEIPRYEYLMLHAQASISIRTPARYMVRLCNHFAHRVAVQRDANSAKVSFPDAPCSMQATDAHLEIQIATQDAATLERLQGVLIRHLKQVAPDEKFDVSWTVL